MELMGHGVITMTSWWTGIMSLSCTDRRIIKVLPAIQSVLSTLAHLQGEPGGGGNAPLFMFRCFEAWS
jgi:hypothetical protein